MLARPASQAVNTLMKYGFGGKIFPVNPKYDEFQGLKCYPLVARHRRARSISSSSAFPRKGSCRCWKSCAQKHVPFVVILSGGFRESGPEGIAREQRMLAIAREVGHAHHRPQLPRLREHPFERVRGVRQHHA